MEATNKNLGASEAAATDEKSVAAGSLATDENSEAIKKAFPVGKIVTAWYDVTGTMEVAKVTRHEELEEGSYIWVEFRDGQRDVFRYDLIDLVDISVSFVQPTSKSALVASAYLVGTHVIVLIGKRWRFGRITKHIWAMDSSRLIAIRITLGDMFITYGLGAFEDDGTHPHIIMLHPKDRNKR